METDNGLVTPKDNRFEGQGLADQGNEKKANNMAPISNEREELNELRSRLPALEKQQMDLKNQIKELKEFLQKCPVCSINRR